MSKRNWCIVLIAIVMLVFLSGCSTSSSGTSDGKEKNELRVALSANPPTLDLHRTTASVSQQIAFHMFESLVTLDKDYKVVPMLAEKIEISPDEKTITFPLRKDVTFHNGKVLNADDVVASINRWRKFSSAGRSTLSKAMVSAKDEHTAVITLPQPSSAVLPALANTSQGCVIMPKEVIEEAGDNNVTQYVGTGPFQFAEWKQDQYIHLEKFANYKPLPGEPNGMAGKHEALVDDLYFIPVADAATRVAGIQSGEYDVADDIPYDNYDILKNDSNLVLTVAKPFCENIIIFNTKSEVFSNVKVRQAVNAALDLDAIMKAATGNPDFYEIDPGLMFKEQAWYVDIGKDKYNQKNLALAKKLLDEAGYNGQPVKLQVTRDYEYLYKSAVVVKDQLEKIGMKVDLEVYDWPTLLSKRKDEKAWDMSMTFLTIFVEPTQTLYLDSRFNWGGWYHNPEMDKLLDEIRATNDFDKAKKIFEQVQSLSLDDAPIAKLGNMHGLIAQRKYVKGFHFFKILSLTNVSVK